MPLVLGRFRNILQLQKASEANPSLRSGATGTGVRAVQLALIELGYPMPRSTASGASLPDGIYGPETTAVVTSFQNARMLNADGVVGPKTLQVLEADIQTLSAARAAGESYRFVRRTRRNR